MRSHVKRQRCLLFHLPPGVSYISYLSFDCSSALLHFPIWVLGLSPLHWLFSPDLIHISILHVIDIAYKFAFLNYVQTFVYALLLVLENSSWAALEAVLKGERLIQFLPWSQTVLGVCKVVSWTGSGSCGQNEGSMKGSNFSAQLWKKCNTALEYPYTQAFENVSQELGTQFWEIHVFYKNLFSLSRIRKHCPLFNGSGIVEILNYTQAIL